MFSPSLPDPREYAHVTPKNNLVIAFQAWQNAGPNEKPQAEGHVRFLLEQALASGDEKLAGIALSLMPSAEAYRTFWHWLAQATWQHPQTQLIPFVVPVVIVAANAQAVNIPGELADISWLRDVWAQHSVFNKGASYWLSNRLLSPAAVQEITPTTAYAWSCLNQPVHDGWPLLPPAAPMNRVQQEAAYLRFIPGLLAAEAGVSWQTSAGAWGRLASQQLSGFMGATGATALALPRAPQPLLAGLEDGRQAQQQIASQLFLGNAIRQFREQGRTPAAVLAMHDNHELRVCLDDGESQLVYSRAIEALDDIQSVEQELVMFLQECQLQQVHVISTLQPDLIGGERHIMGIAGVEA